MCIYKTSLTGHSPSSQLYQDAHNQSSNQDISLMVVLAMTGYVLTIQVRLYASILTIMFSFSRLLFCQAVYFFNWQEQIVCDTLYGGQYIISQKTESLWFRQRLILLTNFRHICLTLNARTSDC